MSNHEHSENSSSESQKDPAQMLKDFLHDIQAKQKTKEWAEQANQFVQANPWMAVAGAAAIGFVLGNLTARRRGER